MTMRKINILLFLILIFSLFCHLLLAQEPLKEEETLFMAKKAFEDGFYEVSIGLSERFLNNYPDSPKAIEASLLIGECFFHQNKFLKALSQFESIFDDPRAKGIRDALYYWTAEVHFKSNNFSQAAVYYNSVIKEFPTSSYAPLAYYSLGWCLFQEQKFQEALEYFKALKEKYPKEPQSKEADFKIVECLYNLKDYHALKEKINSSLGVFSKDTLRITYLYFYLGEANYYLGNFNEAADAYAKALVNNPDERLEALSKLDLAWSYLKLKRSKEAEDMFGEIKQENLEKRSQDVLLLGKAMLMAQTNRVNESKELFEQLLNTTNDPLILTQAYAGAADAFYNLADYIGASQAYREVLSRVNLKEVSEQMLEKMYYNLSWSLLKQGKFKEAIREFQEVVDISNDKSLKASALCQIGDAYQESGDYARARETYSLIIKDYPDTSYNDYARYQLGSTSLKVSDYKAAILYLTEMIKNFPESKLLDDAAYALGLAYFKNQDYNSSRGILIRFQNEFKDSELRLKALYLLGSSLYSLGDYKAAMQVFKEISRISGQDVELTQKAEYGIADCYYRLGEEDEALIRFKSLRSKYPDSGLTPEIIWWLGGYYYQHNELSLARRYFLSIIQDFPKSDFLADAYYALGLTFIEEENTQEALGNFNKALALNKSDIKPMASIAIADIYIKEGKYELALQLYNDTLTRYPGVSNLIYPKIAQAFAKTGDYGNALDYYRKSLDGVPAKDRFALRLRIAEIQETQGSLDEAIKEYLEVVKPANQDNSLKVKALLRIGQIYEDKENPKEAISFYSRIIDMRVPESKFAEERISRIKKSATFP